jgi:hypothetical protein
MLLATLVGGIRLEGDAPMNGSAEKAGKTQVLIGLEPMTDCVTSAYH